jgi:hypothetical protein
MTSTPRVLRLQVLAEGSGLAVDWLTSSFNLDLSLLSRLGGHSQPRTHRGITSDPVPVVQVYCDEKVANRVIMVWHVGLDKGY